jgi:hypothetical protein
MNMKKLLLAFYTLIFTGTVSIAQVCNPPIDPVVFANDTEGVANIEWTAADADCPMLYFEIEYSTVPFAPGEGILESPVNETSFAFPNSDYKYAWVRSVCDCDPFDGNGDGIADANSEWVEAGLTIAPPPPPAADPGMVCSAGPMVTTNLPHLCGEETSVLKFHAFYAPQATSSFPCSSGPQYRLWRNFIAPDSETVSIHMFPGETNEDGTEAWNDYGMAIYTFSCNGPLFECVPSFNSDEPVIIDDLIPCMQYFVAFWNNGYTYDAATEGMMGTTNEVNICDVDLTTGIKNIDNTLFSVFPNPSKGLFNVHVMQPNSSNVQVFDLSGKQVMQQNQLSEFNQIDLGHLPKGTYFIQVNTSETTSIERISIQ